MKGSDNLKHVTSEQTTAEKYGLDGNDIETLFVMRQYGYKKEQLHTYSLAIQKFMLSPEAGDAMSSGMTFGVWKSWFFN